MGRGKVIEQMGVISGPVGDCSGQDGHQVQVSNEDNLCKVFNINIDYQGHDVRDYFDIDSPEECQRLCLR